MPNPSKPDLRVVSAEAEVYDLMRAPTTTAERVQRLQSEARALAVEQIDSLEALLLQAAASAREIAAGGDAYPVGAREIASRLVEDLTSRAGSLKLIVSRTA